MANLPEANRRGDGKAMKEWYAIKELAGLPGLPGTDRGVQKKALVEQWTFQDVPGKGGPNGTRREYHISSLPEETRIALIAPGEPAAPSPSDLESFLATRRITLSPKQLADPAMQRKLACARAVSACPAYSGRERAIAALAAQHNVTPITIRRWVDHVETLAARSSVPRVKLGDEKVDLPESTAFTPEALACGLMSYATDMKAGMKSAYRAMQSQADSRGWQLGDYSNFTRIVKKIPSTLWVRIRRGKTGFELSCVPKIIREWTAIPVQSVLCGDQKIFDYAIYDPETDELINPNGYLWMDCSSRMINGAWIELGHYNSYTVGHSLREALRFGNPDEIYTDWGKPEGSKHISGILAALSGHSTAADFTAMSEKYSAYADSRRLSDEVRHRKARPGVPWVKPIENVMNLIEGRLTAKNLPGYRKRVTDAWENKEIQSLLHAQATRGGLMTPEQFITHVYAAIDEHNRAEKDLKEGRTIIPMDFFALGLRSQTRPAFDGTTLDYICLPRVDRKPHQAIVHVMVRGAQRGYYSPKLSAWRGGKVSVSYDPYDAQAPAVITARDGSLIDIAEPWHVQNPYDRDGLSHKRHRQAELKRWVEENARRLKAAFDLYRPEVLEKTPLKITPATSTARRAEEEKKVYEIRKFEEKQEQKRIIETAALEQKVLAAEFSSLAEASAELDPWTLPEGRERYAHWYALKCKVTLNQPLTGTEEYFFTHYPNTGDYRACAALHADYGNLFIDIGSIGGQA